MTILYNTVYTSSIEDKSNAEVFRALNWGILTNVLLWDVIIDKREMTRDRVRILHYICTSMAGALTVLVFKRGITEQFNYTYFMRITEFVTFVALVLRNEYTKSDKFLKFC